MARRQLTVKRIDPWSVLKFGIVANIVLLAIFLMVMGVVWFIIDRLQLVDQACGIATDVGFNECGINAGNLFRALILLGLLWVVIQTAVYVFLSFMYNLISDLTGGLGVTVLDDSTPANVHSTPRQVATGGHQPGAVADTGSTGRATGPPARPSVGAQQPADASGAVRSSSGSSDDLFRGR